MMEIVIKIPEDVYTRLFDNGIQDNEIATDDICEMARALRLGTPLPEHHGRLIDTEKLIKRINDAEENFKADNEYQTDDSFCDGVLSGVFNIRAMVQQAPTIIEGSDSE